MHYRLRMIPFFMLAVYACFNCINLSGSPFPFVQKNDRSSTYIYPAAGEDYANVFVFLKSSYFYINIIITLQTHTQNTKYKTK